MQPNSIQPEQNNQQPIHHDNLPEIYENAIPITLALAKHDEVSVNENQSINFNNIQSLKASENNKLQSDNHVQYVHVHQDHHVAVNAQQVGLEYSNNGLEVEGHDEQHVDTIQNKAKQGELNHEQVNIDSLMQVTHKKDQVNIVEQPPQNKQHILKKFISIQIQKPNEQNPSNSPLQPEQQYFSNKQHDFFNSNYHIDKHPPKDQIQQNEKPNDNNHINQQPQINAFQKDEVIDDKQQEVKQNKQQQHNSQNKQQLKMKQVVQPNQLNLQDNPDNHDNHDVQLNNQPQSSQQHQQQDNQQPQQPQQQQQQQQNNDHLPPFLLDLIVKILHLDEQDQHLKQPQNNQIVQQQQINIDKDNKSQQQQQQQNIQQANYNQKVQLIYPYIVKIVQKQQQKQKEEIQIKKSAVELSNIESLSYQISKSAVNQEEHQKDVNKQKLDYSQKLIQQHHLQQQQHNLQAKNNQISPQNVQQLSKNQQQPKQTSNIFQPKQQDNDLNENILSKHHQKVQNISSLQLQSKQIIHHKSSQVVSFQQQIKPSQQHYIKQHIVEEKHKYKLTSQNKQSLEENNKDQQPVFIEFTQYVQHNQDNQQQVIKLVDKVKEKEPQQPKETNKKQQESNNKEYQDDINYTFAGVGKVQQNPDNSLKTLNIIKEIKSPTKQQLVGKINKKSISERRVHEVIVQMQKYDQKKTITPRLQQKRSSTKKSINLSKLQPNIELHSNIVSLTVGQILSQQKALEEQRLLNQIDQLKRKLFQLEYRKTIQFPSQEKPSPGKIYRKRDQNLSRVTEQQFSSHKKSEQRAEKIHSAYDKNKYSSGAFSDVKKTQVQHQSQFKKSGPISFRVRRNSKANFTNTEFSASVQKQAGFIKNISRLQDSAAKDKTFQTRKQDLQVLQFQQEQKLNVLHIPIQRQLDFENYFRQYCEKFFIDLGSNVPKRQHSQEELVTMAKNTFRLFGISLSKEKNVILNVKKYKNCVSFVLNQEKTILWYYEGKFYFGGWINNHIGEGQKIGWGYDYVPGKYVYSGYFEENKRSGYGVMKLLQKQKDTIYEGNWANGFKHGYGKQIQSNNTQYVGYWSAGKKQGQGKIKGLDQELYVGGFINGLKSGSGKQNFKNGDSYEGQYKDGKFNGKGAYIWANNSKYEGSFVDGARNGSGKWVANYKQSNSDSYEGVYLNDKKSGFGLYKWKDGTSYEGEFLNDLKHGEGIVSYSDGKTAKFQWYQGNVVAAQPKQKTGPKKLSSRDSAHNSSSSKQQSSKAPVLKYNYLNNQSRSKPTRASKGFQKL